MRTGFVVEASVPACRRNRSRSFAVIPALALSLCVPCVGHYFPVHYYYYYNATYDITYNITNASAIVGQYDHHNYSLNYNDTNVSDYDFNDLAKMVDTNPHSKFISSTVEYCYSKLVASTWCCIDRNMSRGTISSRLRRPGTSWHCSGENGCHDAPYGGEGWRGEDMIWTPTGAHCSSPRILFLHGGSWLYGSPDRNGYASLGSKLAHVARAVVLVIDYPLVPLGNYSSIQLFALEALRWLARHGPGGKVCPGPSPALLVGGDSSGGGSAISLVLRVQAQQELWPVIAGAFAFSPWTNLECDTPTYYYNAFAQRKASGQEPSVYTGDIIFQLPALKNQKQYREVALMYVGQDETLLTDPVASPFFLGAPEVRAKTPFYIAVSGTEAIAGDSWVVASKLAQQGVRVDLDVFPGMWHVFPMYSEGCGSGHELWAAALALNRTAEFVRAAAGAASAGGLLRSCGPALRVSLHYGEPQAHKPWIPVVSLADDCPPGVATPADAPSPGLAFTVGCLCGLCLVSAVLIGFRLKTCARWRADEGERTSLAQCRSDSFAASPSAVIGNPDESRA